MSQNREPPAYQEYAATMLSLLPFRLMSLEARGLLYTMRLECWINFRLPSDPKRLAIVLGVPEQEVCRSLPMLADLFETHDDVIVCPELDNYRQHLHERTESQRKGGKKGAEITNGRKKATKALDTSGDSSTPPTSPQVPRRVSAGSLVQQSKAQSISNQLTVVDDSTEAWLREYEGTSSCSADEYKRASGK